MCVPGQGQCEGKQGRSTLNKNEQVFEGLMNKINYRPDVSTPDLFKKSAK